ncbi:MAG: acyltransferase [Tepidamorphaceae bacterium]
MIHTWSLAVEEQFYILFPIVLILFWCYGKEKVFFSIIIIAAISLLLSEWGWRNNPMANFYLAPTRAWELMAGSIAAFIVQKNGVQKENALALIGLLAIIFAIFVYDKDTPFPSVYSLVPVIGVVLIIIYADEDTITTKILSINPLVSVGLISYSAYLWHQPIFAFARIRLLEFPSRELMLALCALSITLAYLTWRYVEQPFRTRTKTKSLFVFLSLQLY